MAETHNEDIWLAICTEMMLTFWQSCFLTYLQDIKCRSTSHCYSCLMFDRALNHEIGAILYITYKDILILGDFFSTKLCRCQPTWLSREVQATNHFSHVLSHSNTPPHAYWRTVNHVYNLWEVVPWRISVSSRVSIFCQQLAIFKKPPIIWQVQLTCFQMLPIALPPFMTPSSQICMFVGLTENSTV